MLLSTIPILIGKIVLTRMDLRTVATEVEEALIFGEEADLDVEADMETNLIVNYVANMAILPGTSTTGLILTSRSQICILSHHPKVLRPMLQLLRTLTCRRP